ncbi:MAG: NAD(P)/FAD-dependent oxidoreductase [Acidobacteriota bacterium]|nr:MAG: NAD(P)/FAD-dependent oxidoreductase [Acidobacteriota bacterium]
MSKNIAIIGSGFLGMTLALRLAGQGHRVTIFESADRIGGLAAVWEIGDITWDKHYHVTLASDSHTRRLLEEIGLGDELRWVETKTGFYTDGKLYSMSDTAEFLKFPPLGLIGKLRLGATIFYASRVKDWKALEKLSVEEWLTKLSGRKTFQKIWLPLLRAKLGEEYKETSAAFIWATIQRMYAARRSGMKKEQFGYVRGGYARVLDEMSRELLRRDVEIRLNSPIESVEKLGPRSIAVKTKEARRHRDVKPLRISTGKLSNVFAIGGGMAVVSKTNVTELPSAADAETFDSVILTCPSTTAAEILPQLNEIERRSMRSVRYQGIVCASVLMKCPLSRFYVTNITDDSPFTGVIEMSALVDKREFDGNSLIYLPKYVAPGDEIFEMSDGEIRRLFLDGLGRMYPHFNEKDVLAFRVSRVREVFPLPVLNYSEGLAPMQTSIEGVYAVNSSHIVNGTLNVNETVGLAERFFAEHFGND